MSPNRRIFLNIVATYGRSLYALVVGLFCGRWTLMVLGEVDLGLMGVVGGLAGFVAFFNNILASAVARFYAYSVGEAHVSGREEWGLEECRIWFNTALTVHTVVPLILLLVGYPLGVWAVRDFLTIPTERVIDCVWVWRFVCASCFVSMVSVPFNAMYTAKQYIAELTLYSFITTTLNAAMLYYMITHPGIWLAKFAFFNCFLAIIPQVIISLRALYSFPECKVRISYMAHISRIKQMCSFAGWNMIGSLGALLRAQGVQVLINKYFGPRINASMGIANSVDGHCQTLSSAMNGAFSPAVISMCGAGEMDKMRAMAYKVCRYGIALALPFAIPLSLEIDKVLHVWLVNPPPHVACFCLCAIALSLINKATAGHQIAVRASGRIAGVMSVCGTVLLMTLPIAWMFCYKGFGPLAVVYVMIGIELLLTVGRVWFARNIAGMSIRYWLFRVMLPVLLAGSLTVLFGLIPHLCMPPSLVRIGLTVMICELVYLPILWRVILDVEERGLILNKMRVLLNREMRSCE